MIEDMELVQKRAERFKKNRAVDVSEYYKERDGLYYINWVDMLGLLYENGAACVRPILHTNPKDGSSLFMTEQQYGTGDYTHRCYEIDFEVQITWEDGDFEVITWHGPVMNGKNPVADNSLNQNRIWTGYVRQLVKCIAISTGLGFDLYAKSERENDAADEDLYRHDISKIKKRIEEYITFKINKGMDFKDILGTLGISEKQFQSILKGFNNIAWLESKLHEL